MTRPVQTELHRHLDASFRTSTLLEISKQLHLQPDSMTLTAFEDKVLLKRPMESLEEVLERFELFQSVFYDPTVLSRLAFECIEDVHREGTRAVELRYAPSFIAERYGLDWTACLDAILVGVARGAEAYPDLDVGLICISTRDYGADMAARTADFYLAHLDAFVGFDLAGNEIGFPCRMFQAPMARLLASRDERVHVTVHAGEAAGPENVWEAIDLLGATRIGHGVRSIEDPELVTALRERNICLEICPTSNWITQCTPDLAQHPIKALVEQGVPVSINTDDPGLFGNTLGDELAICRDVIGMTEAQMWSCFESAWRFRFG